MKKASRNLLLRSETLRTLATMDLARVAGGNDSGDAQSAKVVAVDSGDFQCPHRAIVAPVTRG
jgi:hypothetical protein